MFPHAISCDGPYVVSGYILEKELDSALCLAAVNVAECTEHGGGEWGVFYSKGWARLAPIR